MLRWILVLAIILINPFCDLPDAAAEGDSLVADDIYSQPLTFREKPPGFREKPIQWTNEPRSFRENPIQWRPEPIGFREKPIPQLDEPRNKEENPWNFIEKDSITVANLAPELKTTREDHLLANNSLALRVEPEGYEKTRISENFEEKNPGYRSINPPNKVRLQDFQ